MQAIIPVCLEICAFLAAGSGTYITVIGVLSYVDETSVKARIDARMAGEQNSGLIGFIYRRLAFACKNLRLYRMINDKLMAAGWTDTAKILSKAAYVGVIVSIATILISDSPVLAGAALILYITAFNIWIGINRSLRLKLFVKQLPYVIESMSSALSAGKSLAQAIEAAAEEADYPARTEILTVSERVKLGQPMSEAFKDLAKNIQIPELKTLLTGLDIQRRSGGNMVEMLRNVGETLETQERLRSNLRVETAHARMSAWVIGAMPGVVTVGIALIDPSYIAPLFNTVQGLIITAIAALMEVAGFIIMRSITRIEI